MTLAAWMVLAAIFLPYATVAAAKWTGPDYDNNAPRAWEARLDGWRARAVAAQNNHFENFAPFAAAVILAQFAHAAQGRVDLLAVGFVVLRVVYTLCYLRDLATARSIVWSLAFLCMLLIFAVAA